MDIQQELRGVPLLATYRLKGRDRLLDHYVAKGKITQHQRNLLDQLHAQSRGGASYAQALGGARAVSPGVGASGSGVGRSVVGRDAVELTPLALDADNEVVNGAMMQQIMDERGMVPVDRATGEVLGEQGRLAATVADDAAEVATPTLADVPRIAPVVEEAAGEVQHYVAASLRALSHLR